MRNAKGLYWIAVAVLALPGLSVAAWADGGGFFYGDVNCDGELNFGDINPFVLALTDPDGYTAAHPDCDLDYADINGDGRADFGDINAFVGLLADPAPYIRTYSDSGCLSGEPDGLCDPDEFILEVDGHTLNTFHMSAEYNCCPDEIAVSLEVQGNVLIFTEDEILTNPCYCICCYDVEASAVNLPSGRYEVVYCWFEYDTNQVECHEEEITIP